MKQGVCLLPIRCKGCGTVFDLWHDLQQELEDVHIENTDFRRIAGQNFCWYCRKIMSSESGEKEPSEEEEDSEQEDDKEVQEELSLIYE
jgi:DNA-directed RNA polymerase subunit N (RpoN/RPB10)